MKTATTTLLSLVLLGAAPRAQLTEATSALEQLIDESDRIGEYTVVERRELINAAADGQPAPWDQDVLVLVRLRLERRIFGAEEHRWALLPATDGNEPASRLALGDLALLFLGRSSPPPKPLREATMPERLHPILPGGCVPRVEGGLLCPADLLAGLPPEQEPEPALLDGIRNRLDATCPRIAATYLSTGPIGVPALVIERDGSVWRNERLLQPGKHRPALDLPTTFPMEFMERAEALAFHTLPRSLMLPGAGPGSGGAYLVLRHRERGVLRVGCSACPHDQKKIRPEARAEMSDEARRFVALWEFIPDAAFDR